MLAKNSQDSPSMSRSLRYAVCAVLGFGVLSMILSSQRDPSTNSPDTVEQTLTDVEVKLNLRGSTPEESTARPKAPKLSEQSRRARDRRAEEREMRSVQALDQERPETDAITVRRKP